MKSAVFKHKGKDLYAFRFLADSILNIHEYYDQEGKITTPTMGAGLRYGNYGFDFGYTIAEEEHPLNNTMRFSLMLKF